MAERVGFEPTVRQTTDNDFRDRPVQPLRHLSTKKMAERAGFEPAVGL